MKNPRTIKGTHYYDVWYEIYQVNPITGETQSISEAKTKKEAQKEVKRLEKLNSDLKGRLEFDMWGSTDKDGWNVVQI